MSTDASVPPQERGDAVELIDRELVALALARADQAMLRRQIEEGLRRVTDRLAERLPKLVKF